MPDRKAAVGAARLKLMAGGRPAAALIVPPHPAPDQMVFMHGWEWAGRGSGGWKRVLLEPDMESRFCLPPSAVPSFLAGCKSQFRYQLLWVELPIPLRSGGRAAEVSIND